MMAIKTLARILEKTTHILPLAIFRMVFGVLMAFSMFRFIYKGWVEACFGSPDFHFTYQWFTWVKPFNPVMMYIIVFLCGLSAIGIALGYLYRFSTLLFFLSFTYLELIEKSWYLNHYYFVSLVAFLLIWVPANGNYALDSHLNTSIKTNTVPLWTILVFKLQLCTVYFFGGIAKLKSDWLLEAQPLKIWLKARTDLPIIGSFFEYDSMPYLMSWSGMVYDLMIPFLLFKHKTRPIAYVLVVVFHVLTYALFNIGMFPWLMIFGSLIFISFKEWKCIFSRFNIKWKNGEVNKTSKHVNTGLVYFFIAFFVFQWTIPLRHYFLSDNVLWTENGMRFAWHVMVMEKSGYTEFSVKNNTSGEVWKVYPSQHLTPIQDKQMSFQPDMIWQYAQYLKKSYQVKTMDSISVYVNSRVALNGRPSQVYINPKVDLASLKRMGAIYNYVLPLK